MELLYVDDEPSLLELGKEFLELEPDVSVTTRLNPVEALALLNDKHFDIIVSDYMMPEMTGLELAREILAIRADIPIIMCTGFSHLVDADAAQAAGIKTFVMKPLTRREIAKTIRKVLEG